MFHIKRIGLAACVGCLAISLTGCVYIRLLKFKNQMNDFDTYVEVDDSSGLGLKLTDPVVLDTDFVFITQSQPTLKRELDSPANQAWVWKFSKEQKKESDTPFSLNFETRFEDGVLTRLDLDPKLLEIVPSDFLVEIFRSFGKAKINSSDKSATAEMNQNGLSETPLPSMNHIMDLMGQPTESSVDEGHGIKNLHYTFNFHNPDDDSVSGTFKIRFKGKMANLEEEILSFQLEMKGR